MIAAWRAAGIDAIDGPFGDFRNDKVYLKQATYAASLGAIGKWCTHPDHVFAPPPRDQASSEDGRSVQDASWRRGLGLPAGWQFVEVMAGMPGAGG